MNLKLLAQILEKGPQKKIDTTLNLLAFLIFFGLSWAFVILILESCGN